MAHDPALSLGEGDHRALMDRVHQKGEPYQSYVKLPIALVGLALTTFLATLALTPLCHPQHLRLAPRNLLGGLAIGLTALVGSDSTPAITTAATVVPQMMSQLAAPKVALDESSASSVGVDNAELKKRLTPLQYKVAVEGGTEPAFKNEYWNEHRKGTYVSVISGKPLFRSEDKFDSGTGWPSFMRPIDELAVVYRRDTSYGMDRVEVLESGTGAHLGHVFPDGPIQTGLRYCMNSAAFRFIPDPEQ